MCTTTTVAPAFCSILLEFFTAPFVGWLLCLPFLGGLSISHVVIHNFPLSGCVATSHWLPSACSHPGTDHLIPFSGLCGGSALAAESGPRVLSKGHSVTLLQSTSFSSCSCSCSSPSLAGSFVLCRKRSRGVHGNRRLIPRLDLFFNLSACQVTVENPPEPSGHPDFSLSLQLIPEISSLSWFTTVVPLVLVLTVSAVKDAMDDVVRVW